MRRSTRNLLRRAWAGRSTRTKPPSEPLPPTAAAGDRADDGVFVSQLGVSIRALNLHAIADYMIAYAEAGPDDPAERERYAETASAMFRRLLWEGLGSSKGIYLPPIPGTQYENGVILASNLLSSLGGTLSSLRGTTAHELLHAMKVQGVIKRDVPVASAVGYFEHWFHEKTASAPPPKDHGDPANLFDDWPHVLELVTAGRTMAREKPESVQDMVDGVLQRYDTNSTEDTFSYRAGAILAGVALELFQESRFLGLQYFRWLSLGEFHQASVQKSMAERERIEQERGIPFAKFEEEYNAGAPENRGR